MRYLPENITSIDTELIDAVLASISEYENYLYLDEAYIAVMNHIYLTYGMLTFSTELTTLFDGWYINPYDEVSLDGIVSFARAVRFVNTLVYHNLEPIYQTIESIENEIVDRGMALGAQVANISVSLDKIKASMSRDANMTSVKDEVIIYDTFDQSTIFPHEDGVTIAVDTITGFLSLKQNSLTAVGIRDVKVDMGDVPKGRILSSIYGVDTFSTIENGYFHGRTFSSTPRINDVNASNQNAMFDNSLTTAYEVELNSTVILREGLSMELSLAPYASANLFSIAMVVPTTESTISSPSYTVILDSFAYNGVEHAATLLDNRITTDKLSAGKYEPLWSYGDRGAVVKTFPIPPTPEGGSLVVRLKTTTPQLASFPEIVFMNNMNKEVYRMNYFETLAVRRYDAPEGTLDPRTLFTPEQLSRLASNISLSKLTVHTDTLSLYRYYLGIREIGFGNAGYLTEGSITSRNINPSARAVSAVEVYANEVIPQGCSITYFVSTNRETWVQIIPANRSEQGPKRVVYDSKLNMSLTDTYVNEPTDQLYVKIAMKGSGKITPIVKSLIVRMKVETD